MDSEREDIIHSAIFDLESAVRTLKPELPLVAIRVESILNALKKYQQGTGCEQ